MAISIGPSRSPALAGMPIGEWNCRLSKDQFKSQSCFSWYANRRYLNSSALKLCRSLSPALAGMPIGYSTITVQFDIGGSQSCFSW